jgi:hypothetical protein
MSWRVHITEGSIRRLDILSGKPSLLAVWLSGSQVLSIDLQSGAQKHARTLDLPDARERGTESGWRAFADSLYAANHVHFPYVRVRNGAIFQTKTGDRRLIHTGGAELFLETNGVEMALNQPAPDDADAPPFVAMAMDRSTGAMIAALDTTARLTLYREHTRIGTYPVPLTITDDTRPIMLPGRAGAGVFLTDGRQLLAVDMAGKVRYQTALHFTVGAMGCSSDGKRLALTDLDANIIRVYNTAGLIPTHQRFAVDLLAEARRVQNTSLPEAGRAALGAIAINSKGVVAFSLAGMLCVTSITHLSAIPRPSSV